MSQTKASLICALNELIVERGYCNVTVENILQRADVGRTTFYSHFKNKDSLLLFQVSRFPECPGGEGFRHAGEPIPDITPLLELIRSKSALINSLKQTRELESLKTTFQSRLSDYFEQLIVSTSGRGGPTAELRPFVHFLSGGLVGLITEWFEAGMQALPAVVNAEFSWAVKRVILALDANN